MKRFFIAIVALLTTTISFAQSKGIDDWKNLRVISNERKINFTIDWSEAIITNLDFSEWVESEKDWKESEIEIRNRFIQSFNSVSDYGDYPHRLGSYSDSPFTMTLRILRADYDGSAVTALITVVDDEGNVIFEQEQKSAKGRWGSVANLMGDALEVMGHKVGVKFNKNARLDNRAQRKEYEDKIYRHKK